jgi:hypothetical protein
MVSSVAGGKVKQASWADVLEFREWRGTGASARDQSMSIEGDRT